jgi:N-acetylmuramoyl-L-alanine amidase
MGRTLGYAIGGWLLCVAGLALPARAGYPFLMLPSLADRLGLSMRADGDRRLIVETPCLRLTLENNSRRLVYNGMSVQLNAAPLRYRGSWIISEADAENVITPLAMPDSALSELDTDVVLLDPGHGGDAPGASGPGQVPEKKLVLDIAKRARLKLREAGITVYLTRDRDRSVELGDRCRRASQLGADVFVSIHLNSSGDRSASGFETYVVPSPGYPSSAQADTKIRKSDFTMYPANRYDAANTLLACYLQRGLLSCTGGEDRGVKRARFEVITYTPCPSALVECGFLSSRQEGSRLLAESFRDRIAEGISRGIMTYLSRVREARMAGRRVKIQDVTRAPTPPAARLSGGSRARVR